MRRYEAWLRLIILLVVSLGGRQLAAQLKVTDFVIYTNDPPNVAGSNTNVTISSSTVINGGVIGSSRLVTSTGNTNIKSSIFSDGIIQLTNGNTVTGKIAARNILDLGGNALSVGSNAILSGNIDVHGNILVSGGKVFGKVTHPQGTTYVGPKPQGGESKSTPTLPDLPQLPAVSTFPSSTNENITTTRSLDPDKSYGSLLLGGGQTITLSGPGIYTFKSIKNAGGNNLVFDFKGLEGNIIIYIHGDVDLSKLSASIKGGGSAARIYAETHGDGSGNIDKTIAWNVDNGSSGAGTSRWFGTVYAPYGGVNIGSGSGSAEFSGAVYSGKKVLVQSGATINYVPFVTCEDGSFGSNCTLDYYPPRSTGKYDGAIGSELNSLYENFGNVKDSAKTIFIIDDGSVYIEVIAKQGTGIVQTLRTLLETEPYGMTDFIDNGASSLTITGKYPIVNLKKLDSLPTLISYVRPLFPPVSGFGITTTQGDRAMNSVFQPLHLSMNHF